ncbi:MAG TPA: glycosyltransferase family 39 protein [Candidatus Gastranaerophilales bacterium]|nr:glycosyltransferase family 39 protein [Candidatus Gastranaerophilales bacterium]
MLFISKIKEYKNIILLLLIIITGFLLRMWHLDKPEGLWFDEMHTYIEARMPIGDLFKLYFTKHIHAPLFYIILHYWMKLFGEADFVLRVLPVIFGALTIPVAYLCGKELKCDKTALLAAFLTAINSLLIYYSQELRFYSLVALFTSLIALFLLRTNNNPSKLNIAGLILANTGLLYTHSISFVFVFFEFLFFGLYFFFKQKNSFKPLIITGFITFILYIPYLFRVFNLVNQGMQYSGVGTQWWATFSFSKILFALGDSFSPFLIAFANPPENYFAFVFQDKLFSIVFLIFVFLPIIISLYGIIIAVTKKQINLTLLLMCLGFTVVFGIVSAQGKVVCVSRYLIEITPVFILLTAYGLSFQDNIFKKSVLIFLISVNLLFLIYLPISAPKKTRPLGFKPATDMLNKYNFTDKDSFVLIGSRKILFDKDFTPSRSDFFYYIFNCNVEIFPFFLTKDTSLKDLSEIGSYMIGFPCAKESEKKLKNLYIKMAETQPYKEYLKHKNYKKFNYDYYKNILTSPNNIFADTKLKEEIFSKLEHNNHLVIISFKGLVIYPDVSRIKEIANNKQEYENTILMYLVLSRINNDLVEFSKQNLEFEKKESSKMWDIYIFKKRALCRKNAF